MTVRTRLLVLITMLVTGCSLGTAGMLAWLAWRSILARAEEDAVLLARLRSHLGGKFLGADRRRGGKTAWRADADGSLPGRPARRPRPARRHRRAGIAAVLLQTTAARTGLDEIWITDQRSIVDMSSMDEVNETLVEEFSFGDLVALEPMRAGRVAGVVTEPIHRAVDDRSFVYAGVPTQRGRLWLGMTSATLLICASGSACAG